MSPKLVSITLLAIAPLALTLAGCQSTSARQPYGLTGRHRATYSQRVYNQKGHPVGWTDSANRPSAEQQP